MHVLNPVIGAAGILLGARFGFHRKP
jgi:hypothetical protein